MDKMRESVFACLQDIEGASFLDLFTGSGIIAMEAASRGASFIEAVEMDKLKKKILIENVSISPVRINCRFIPVELYVKRSKKCFDIIFADPPFVYRYKWELLNDIALSCLASCNTKILIHRPYKDRQKENDPLLEKYDSRKYGRSVVDFFVVRK